jgi:transcriptional regulator of acetoin/glycerol metabolism
VEKEILSAEYARHEGNISRLALALGMDRSHLYTKLKEHKIHITKK